jgi:hypothetical protein
MSWRYTCSFYLQAVSVRQLKAVSHCLSAAMTTASPLGYRENNVTMEVIYVFSFLTVPLQTTDFVFTPKVFEGFYRILQNFRFFPFSSRKIQLKKNSKNNINKILSFFYPITHE